MTELTLSELQLELFALLKEIDSICRDEGLRYSLYAGTLLGAIRHKGFIPWDDDADIVMPREDYERFLALFDQGKLASGRELVNARNSPFPYPFTKYVNKEIHVESPQYKDFSDEYLWVDVFPIDVSFDSFNEMKRFVRWRSFMQKLAFTTTAKTDNSVKQAIKNVVAFMVGKRWPAKRCMALIEEKATQLSCEETDHVAMMAWGGYGESEWFSKSMFDDYVEVPFMGDSLMSIADWDTCLTQMYGDYMTLPPEEKRETHNLRVWR